MKTSDHRKKIPVGVRLHACLLLLGFSDEQIAAGIDWNHNPPLGLRAVTGGVMRPAPNDPHFIEPLTRPDHKIRTNGTKATTAGSDKHMIAKAKRMAKKTAAFQKLLGMGVAARRQERERRTSKWPKGRKIRSRADAGK